MRTPSRAPQIACLLLALLSNLAWGDGPARSLDELVDPKAEPVYRVTTARVILADYDLIRRDFEKTRSMTDAQIDQWLLDHGAYVSYAQAAQTRTNTHIQIVRDAESKAVPFEGYRPQLYGRALVFEADEGLLDVKGAGSLKPPELASHRTGLATLGEMIREFIFQKKLQQLLDHGGSGLNTVQSYAVIDWGFDTFEYSEAAQKYVQVPVGAVFRRAHARPRLTMSGNHFASPGTSALVERMLRNYGITSSGDEIHAELDSTNIQVSKNQELLDFGAYQVKDHFDKPIQTYEGKPIFSAAEIKQPYPRLQLPMWMWGATESGRAHPRYDNLWIWSHKVAEDLRSGKAQPIHVREHLNNFLSAGAPPEDLRDIFKGVFSEANIRAEENRIFLHGFTLNRDWIDVEGLTNYLKNNHGELPEPALNALKTELAKPYGALVKIWKLLSEGGAFTRDPKLEETILLASKREIPSVIANDLLDRGKMDLIKTLLEHEKFYPDDTEKLRAKLAQMGLPPAGSCGAGYSSLSVSPR